MSNPIINTKNIILFVSLLLAGFHLYTASFGILPSYFQSSFHWGAIATIIFLLKPLKIKSLRIVDYALILINWYLVFYLITVQDELVTRAGAYTTQEVLLGILALLIGLEAARRTLGYILPVLSILFIFYAMFGNLFPGMLQTASFSLDRISPYLYTGNDGLFGQVLLVSAQFIFLFVLFGAILNITGAGTFFVNLAYSIAGKVSGGPAQAAVLSSMLMGTINGSGAANVVTTGSFTIPLMKRVGFKPAYAGAVEAVASNGGQIMPPVMGAVAFLMAEITGISYTSILVAALIPALLYFITLSSSVYFNAKKNNFKGLPSSELPSFWKTFKEGWLYLVPLILLVVILVAGYSPQKAAFYSIVVTFLVGLIKDRAKMTFKNILDALYNAAKGIMPIASACLVAGSIMGIIQLTGLGIKISGILEMLADGSLLIALILTMLTSLLLGMGLPTSAAYLILAVLVAPALVNMGVSTMAAHLFILYYGALSTITPPVALSVFAAAGLAESNVWKTGVEAVKLASAGFIIPFMFTYNDVLLLNGELWPTILAVSTALLGCISLAMAFMGWFLVNLRFPTKCILLVGAILLLIPSPFYLSIIGLVLNLVTLFIETKTNHRTETTTNTVQAVKTENS
ncbi:TRAP transporter permease [Aquibacillus sp. 3ASR75-11]|uniref:TRAP transporter permease n=1 Tax=Terrihalobacillus insolitus TaxID=2950438 RepID=A0A9X4AN76_9BACI|nr:TRAP transporter permease [Terrihalobacillus insolitus]MDC3424223.1 TRAP transporter permease [Terrihalobacillus insolitus]